MTQIYLYLEIALFIEKEQIGLRLGVDHENRWVLE